MSGPEDRLVRLTLAAIPVAIVALGLGASLLPGDLVVQVACGLTVWLMLSLPIGVLVGHCILGED